MTKTPGEGIYPSPFVHGRWVVGNNWGSRMTRIGMAGEDWRRVTAAAEKLPGRSRAERWGILLRLGAALIEEEGLKALERLADMGMEPRLAHGG